MSVLVVDDSEIERRFVASLLQPFDSLDIQHAASGLEAVTLLKQAVPQLVVTDLFMPEMDGLELVSYVRENHPGVPVIVMTSRGNEELAAESLHRGAASYVPKRMLSQILPTTVRRLLEMLSAQSRRTKLLGCLEHATCEFVLDNDWRMVPPLVAYLAECVGHVNHCDETERLRISVALEEALNNALFHGNLEISSDVIRQETPAFAELAAERQGQPPYCDRKIRVRAEFSPQVATFVIHDEGPGFDWTRLPDPRDPANLDQPCGRGVMLMQTFMDEVRFEDGGNRVTMLKRSVRGAP